MKNLSCTLVFFILFLSCQEERGADTGVKVETKGVFTPLTMTVVDGKYRGETIPGQDADLIKIKIKNNSNFSLTEMKLNIDESDASNAGVKFHSDGEDQPASPGSGGTCTGVLASGSICFYHLSYLPISEGEKVQKIRLDYKNLVDEVSVEEELSFLTGNAATLIFTEGTSFFSFGIIERTFQDVYTKALTIKNTGGLFAKDLNILMTNTSGDEPYTITSTTCLNRLAPNESCNIEIAFTSKNFEALDNDENYIDDLIIQYNSGPDGTLPKSLSGNFDSISATIEAKMAATGFSSVEFPEIVVGNLESKTIKFRNNGFKEGILRKIHFKDASDTTVATCVKTSASNQLTCRDINNIGDASGDLALPVFPYKVEDTSGCLNEISKLNYTRDENKILSDSTLVTVAGGDQENFGGECQFKITFHPSITFKSDGNFNDYKIMVEYDSTWKNNVELYHDDLVNDDHHFTIQAANYLKAAVLNISEYQYSGSNLNRLTGSTDEEEIYDLGRVALITNANYGKHLRIRYTNNGSVEAEVQTFTDGEGFEVKNFGQNIPAPAGGVSYFRNTRESNCNVVSSAGICTLFSYFTPMSVNDSSIQNDTLYDEGSTYIDGAKVFRMTYKDGSTFNDDLSPAPIRSITVKTKAFLVSQGVLVFEDTSPLMGDIGNQVSGSTKLFHVLLKNEGTAAIPYIKTKQGRDLFEDDINNKIAAGLYVFDIIDRAGPENGATKDCYELIDFSRNDPVANSTPADTLGPGENCSLTVKMSLKNVDRQQAYTNGNDSATVFSNWGRVFSLADNGTEENWEKIQTAALEDFLSFRFYDGDGVSGDGYPAAGQQFVEGYGVQQDILGGQGGDYKLGVRFHQPARLAPTQATPIVVSTIRREGFSIGTANPLAGEWGDPVSGVSINPAFTTYADEYPALLGFQSSQHVNALSGVAYSGTEEYVYFGGTYRADGLNYTGSLRVGNFGGATASDITIIDQGGDNEVQFININLAPTVIDVGVPFAMNFSFDATNPGVYSRVFEVFYESGEEILTSIEPYTTTPRVHSFRARVFYEVLPVTTGNISVTTDTYTVVYTEGAGTSETLDGSPTNVLINTHGTPAAGNEVILSAIKGSQVYAKRRFYVTNDNPDAITNFRVHLKGSFGSEFLADNGGGLNYFLQNSGAGSCQNVTLNQGETCFFDIRFAPGQSEPDYERVAFLTFDQGSNQFMTKGFTLSFDSRDPALLEVASLSKTSVADENGNGIPGGSYRINLGGYFSAHTILNVAPKQTVNSNQIVVTNTSAEKASFLKAYRNINGPTAVISGDEWHVIYSRPHADKLDLTVEANRACIYGDEEVGGDPETWGFNSSTLSQCRVRFSFDIGENYMGGDIDLSENIMEIEFYNNGRASTDEIYFHPEGFVEPNRSVASNYNVQNLEVDEFGDLSFSFEPFIAANPAWGAIDSYKVIITEFENSLNNVFVGTFSNSQNVAAGVVNFSGLLPGTYYYIYIAANRTSPLGNSYLSVDPLFEPIEFITPTDITIYNHEYGALIDKYLSPEGNAQFGSQSQMKSICSGSTMTLKKAGAVIVRSKKLIYKELYDNIRLDSENSSYPVDNLLHWMNDNPVNIASVFDPFDCSETTASFDDDLTPGDDTFYIKDCSDCTCNNLHIFRGSDGEFPPNTTLYIDGNAFTGGARCYIQK